MQPKIDWNKPVESLRNGVWVSCTYVSETEQSITYRIPVPSSLLDPEPRTHTFTFLKNWPPAHLRNAPEHINGQKSDELKKEGMQAAAEAKTPLLQIARDQAYEIAKQRGWVTADDVSHHQLGPAAGSLFRDNRFEWNGEWKKSKQVKNHSRLLRVWIPSKQ